MRSPVVVPRQEYDEILSEIDRAVDVLGEMSRLRVELVAIRRRLKQLDPGISLETLSADEPTPVRPPSRTDIQAAFENATDFASGRRRADSSPSKVDPRVDPPEKP